MALPDKLTDDLKIRTEFLLYLSFHSRNLLLYVLFIGEISKTRKHFFLYTFTSLRFLFNIAPYVTI